MNVLIISNLILLFVFSVVYFYIKNLISKSLFYNVFSLELLIYFIFPCMIFILNIIVYVVLRLNDEFLVIMFVPLILPGYKILFSIFRFISEYQLYKTYENRIYLEVIKSLSLMKISVDKSNITLSLKKINNDICCDVYIKISDIQDKDNKKDELKFMLRSIFINIKFNIIFDVKFNYKKKVFYFIV